jgi:hypothetical protein
MSAAQELWKVECPDGVFETDIETLMQWIGEGIVRSEDRVCKGNLRWIEAYKVPTLKRVFDGEQPIPRPAPITPPPVDELPETVTPEVEPPRVIKRQAAIEPPPAFQPPKAQTIAGLDLSSIDETADEKKQTWERPADYGKPCYFHSDVAPEHVCRVCGNVFCSDCVKTVGATKVVICPLCGDMCKRFHEVQQQAENLRVRTSGFGLLDFYDSIAYPFRHLIALIFGALVYGLFQLGGIRTIVIAFAVMFGCIAHAINQVAVGRMNRSFLPDFSAFDLWDDFFRPIFLGLGIVIVTLGPMIVLTLFIVSNVFRAPTAQESAPPAQSKMLTSKDFDDLVNSRDESKSEELQKKIAALDPKTQMLEQVKKVDEETSTPFVLSKFLQIPLWSRLALLLSIAWALFYFPMALTVAGYSENFKATINPLTGLDTMRRMGGTFVKAFLMYLLVFGIGAGMLVVIGIVTAPLDIPLMGNLPAKFFGGIVTFYFGMVIACLMGLALFKCADQVGIAVD